MYSSDFTPADCAFFNICSPDTTPTPNNDRHGCPFHGCGMQLLIILLIMLLPCYTFILWFVLRGIFYFVRGVFRAVWGALCAIVFALFGRVLHPQSDSTEDDGLYAERGMSLPLVLCGTWLRPPSPIEEAPSASQSIIQSESAFISPQVAYQSALAAGVSGSTVPAGPSTWPIPNDSMSSPSIQNSPKTSKTAVIIHMPSPVFQCSKDREGPPYGSNSPNNVLSEYQIGIAQVQCVQ